MARFVVGVAARLALAATVAPALVLVLCVAVTDAQGATAANPKTGALSVKVIGLPKGARGAVTISGPGRFKRTIAPRGRVEIRGLQAGSYGVMIGRVTLRRSGKAIKRGAVALPQRRHLRVRVRPRRLAKANVRYGTIINPGVRTLRGQVEAVLGDATSPSSVVIRGTQHYREGTILSASPSQKLPHGLLEHVTSIAHRKGATTVDLRPASIYEVAPNMTLDAPLSTTDGASASLALKCDQSLASGLHPYARVSDVHVTGGWTTTRVAFVHVTTGATVNLNFRAGVGIAINSTAQLSCSLPLPAFGVEGMAGPIPVYGAIRPGVSAKTSAGVNLHAGGSTNVTLGAAIGGIPPTAQPRVGFSAPKFDFGADVFASTTASISLNAELGIGVANGANLHLALGNSLDFTGTPGSCSWDLNLGTFSAGGQLGPLGISTPSTPALFHRNLWQAPCGPSAAPPAPAPAPISLPLTRATMSWDTDSDIDLYIWDQAGDVAYFGDQSAIPDAQLVEDIIPSAGEVPHPPEVFREDASPNRTYTYGICVYRGAGGDVTLNVVDPGGGVRSFNRTLSGTGDSTVVTSSPNGSGYQPDPNWCLNVGP